MKLSHLALPMDYILAFSMERVGPLLFRQSSIVFSPFPLASGFLGTREKGRPNWKQGEESTSICHSFQKADISNELVADEVSAFARSLLASQHLTLPLISPALSFSSETGKERKTKDSEVRQQSKSKTE